MTVSPRLFLEEPPKGYRDLPVPVSLWPRWLRPRILQYRAADLGQLRLNVSGIGFNQLAVRERHWSIMTQPSSGPLVNIAHFFESRTPLS
jgi:hypothetical protein